MLDIWIRNEKVHFFMDSNVSNFLPRLHMYMIRNISVDCIDKCLRVYDCYGRYGQNYIATGRGVYRESQYNGVAVLDLLF